MIYEKIFLDKNNENVFLEVFAPDKIKGFTRSAMLVIPGGGYYCVCSDREGEPIAMAFLAEGYCSFVLHYSVGGKLFPTQLIEASWAMKYIKDNADKYGLDKNRVFAVGFSAGGHLCGSLAAMWKLPEIYEAIDMPYGYNKPTGAMMIYPVVSSDYHELSFKNLLGKTDFDENDRRRCNIEANVDADTAPIFMVHTSNDQVVDVKNPLTLAWALAAAGHKFELHIYPDAPHGLALGNDITCLGNPKWSSPQLARWVSDAAIWAKSLTE